MIIAFDCDRNGCKVSISSNVSVFMCTDEPLATSRRQGAKISVGSLSTDVTDVLSSEIMDQWPEDREVTTARDSVRRQRQVNTSIH